MCYAFIEAQLRNDEGCVFQVYLDRYHNPTCGVGHKVLQEDGLHPGDTVSQDEVDAFLRNDILKARQAVARLVPQQLPTAVYVVLVNMAFNLGETGLANFPKFLDHIRKHEWVQAAIEMKNSRWYKQVGNRAVSLAYEIMTQPLDPIA